jgi:MoCo/4Fe-4S cofactor protein with predicted Tat translocation signal
MSNKKYWQSFAELNDNEGFRKQNQDEFGEDLPFEEFADGTGILDAKTPRRDFLKYVGFSTAAATLAASCKVPVRKAIPYVNRPENVTPGISKYYATTFVQDGEVVPAVAKVRDGRPIKIEGNTLSSLTKGGTSARMQASVLDLYDTYRITHPKRKNGSRFEEIPTYDQLDASITSALASAGGPVVLLTGTIVSPSTNEVIKGFLSKYPGSTHVQYDAVSYSGLLQANESSFGKRVIPSYQFDKAAVIVSLGADFLGTWLSPVEFARQYATGRKINEQQPKMSRHYQLESFLSLTGSNADERYVHRPSETGTVAMALLNAVGGSATAVNIADAKLAQGIQKIAKDLKANAGRSLVVCGSNDPNVQVIVNAINSAIGAIGTTVNFSTPLQTKAGIDRDMANLVNAMNGGQVGALLIYDANPAYDYFNAPAFISGLKKVRLSVSFNPKMDETSELCNYIIPTHHYLESWGDAEPKPGFISFIQPTIFPLFKTRPFQTSLLKWSGNNTDWETWFRTYWTGKVGGVQAFEKALQDGVWEKGAMNLGGTGTTSPMVTDTINQNGTTTTFITPTPASTGYNNSGVAGAVSAITAGRKGGKNEVVLYQNVGMGSGKQSGNPWLLELPDPVTKITWDNFAMISVSLANELGININTTDYEYYRDKPLIDITVNGKKVTLPVFVVPGVQKDTIAVALGYGRNEAYGKASYNVGQNVFGFARFNTSTNTVDYYNDVTVSEKTVGSYKLANTQVHNSYENRTEVVKETTLATFLANPNAYKEFREELTKDFAHRTGNYATEATLYNHKNADGTITSDHIQPGLKWGMSIDMNSCIGCGACVVACHSENNVPVVGKSEVLRAHEMHWLRIDRYFVSDEKNPDDLKAVVFQPMLCQHCDNAPCENVCPVAATMHSSEGLNQMAYNRCIGTRYCANNCPYKVRRFNWGDYTGSSTHGVLGPNSGVGKLDDVVHQMNDDLTRMVLNPDVVTRSRGVMEKCTFCVQRIQEGKLKAKMENRVLGGDEVVSACAQACPTNAIVFSNVHDKTSSVSKIRENNQQRLFYVIEQIHTLPNINYLAKIRNTDEIIANRENGGEHAQQQEEPGVGKNEQPVNAH